MRTISVVTTSRADYGVYRPLLKRLAQHPQARLRLLVSGMHLAPEFGLTVRAIEAEGLEIAERLEMLLSSDTAQGVAKSLGLGVQAFAQSFARERPDLLVVLGDRFEMYAAALAALPFAIPVAHLFGGELTLGAIDDALRHSMSKLSHLHFVATEEFGRRVVQLGEEPWRVTVCGALSLENLDNLRLLSPQELSSQLGISMETPPLLVTYHPVTLEYQQAAWQMAELLAALEELGHPVIFTLPNADTSGRQLAAQVRAFVSEHDWSHMVEDLGTLRYFSLMSMATAMVGNSSSGLVEAPSFRLPVVNVGNRQAGRTRGANVIDVGYDRREISAGLALALDPAFRQSLSQSANPYYRPRPSAIIAESLATSELNQRLLSKRFWDLPADTPGLRPGMV